jgi:hypothetical protein
MPPDSPTEIGRKGRGPTPFQWTVRGHKFGKMSRPSRSLLRSLDNKSSMSSTLVKNVVYLKLRWTTVQLRARSASERDSWARGYITLWPVEDEYSGRFLRVVRPRSPEATPPNPLSENRQIGVWSWRLPSLCRLSSRHRSSESSHIVTGPSLTNSTAISAPKTPCSTWSPSSRNCSAKRSTSGEA